MTHGHTRHGLRRPRPEAPTKTGVVKERSPGGRFHQAWGHAGDGDGQGRVLAMDPSMQVGCVLSTVSPACNSVAQRGSQGPRDVGPKASGAREHVATHQLLADHWELTSGANFCRTNLFWSYLTRNIWRLIIAISPPTKWNQNTPTQPTQPKQTNQPNQPVVVIANPRVIVPICLRDIAIAKGMGSIDANLRSNRPQLWTTTGW